MTTENAPIGIEKADFIEGSSFLGYTVKRCTELRNPLGAQLAWQIQAASYQDMGYVTQDAIDSDGTLYSDIDTSRGGHITYHISFSDRGDGVASVRMGDIPRGGSVNDLSSYSHAKSTLYPEYLKYIDDFIEAEGSDSVRDCAAICKLPDQPAISTYAAVRDAIQQTLRNGKNELWVMALTTKAFAPLKEAFGSSIVRSGDDVPPSEGDQRISGDTRLVPAIAEIRMVPQRLLEDIESAESQHERDKYIRTLWLVCSGMDDCYLSDNQSVIDRIRMYVPE